MAGSDRIEPGSHGDVARCGCSLGPRRSEAQAARPGSAIVAHTSRGLGAFNSIVAIPRARAEVGTDHPHFRADGEGPRRRISLNGFGIDACTVTNARFATFVEATGYRTDAERYGWSFVFFQHIVGDADTCHPVVGVEWWRRVEGAMWCQPEGPGSDIGDRADHPVVHISQNDAIAFATWSGGRLPSEAEWEHAARGGLTGVEFPWGNDEPCDDGPYHCNIWQGSFPTRNTVADGFASTAPARSFRPNGYGLYNMCGNVWEWCADRFQVRSLARSARDRNANATRDGLVVQKGGSVLCHKSYCYRYRIAARIGSSPDTSISHSGFRVAYAAAPADA